MKIEFMEQKEAEKIDPSVKMAVISIATVNSANTRRLKEGWGARIDLDFCDVNEKAKEEGTVCFDIEMARKLAEWVKNLPQSINHIVVHCFQGMSRSAAIAKVLLEKQGQDIPDIYEPYYNKLVYKLFKEAMNEK